MRRASSGFYLPLRILELLLFVINISNAEPVDGQWSAWIDAFPCNVTCGNGTQTRYRFCNNPAPSNGGTNCQGDDRQTISCSKDCPVDGQWSSWIDIFPCSVTCGNGTKTRSRFCNNPKPSNGGTYCQGDRLQTVSCSKDCPVDGQWSSWINWFSCSVTCGSGINRKYRFCNNPSPSNGGLYCRGNEQETEICFLRGCPAFYEWSPWSNWMWCSVSCGSGTRTRYRSCNGTFYMDCRGEFSETEACSTRSCPAFYEWSPWSNWMGCSVSCGSGTRRRYRSCNGTFYMDCKGEFSETEACSTRSCPAVYEWNPWTYWYPCSVTCGGGERERIRSCNGTYFMDCKGDFRETEACSTRSCPDLKYSTDFPYPRIDPAPSSRINYTVLSIVIGVLIIITVVAGIAFGVYRMRFSSTCGLKAPEASIHVTAVTGSSNVPTHVTAVTGSLDRHTHVTAVTGSLDRHTHVTAVTGSSDDTSLNYPPPPYSYIERMYGAAEYPSPPPSYSSLDHGHPPPSYSSLQSLFQNTGLMIRTNTNVVAYRNNNNTITVQESN